MLSANVGSLRLGRSVFAVGHACAGLCAADGRGGIHVLHAPVIVVVSVSVSVSDSVRAGGATCDSLPPHDGRVEAVPVRIVRY